MISPYSKTYPVLIIIHELVDDRLPWVSVVYSEEAEFKPAKTLCTLRLGMIGGGVLEKFIGFRSRFRSKNPCTAIDKATIRSLPDA